jgi:hypothetical protein
MENQQYKKKFLFIDDAYVVKTQHLKRTTNQAVKHRDPVFKMDAPWDTASDELNGLNVAYDEQDQLFKMWYGVTNRVEDWGGMVRKFAYATSADGIHWERPILNLVENDGSRQNNYFTSTDLADFSPSILIDPSAPASRRFKMIFVCSDIWGFGQVNDWSRHHSSLNLAYSEDGLIWDRPRNVNPVLRGISDGVFMFFYDVDRRKYQLFTRRVPNLPRDISLYESFDLVNWEDCGRIFVAGDEHDPPTLYNIHQATVLQYEDYKLALLNTMHGHPLTERLGVFQEPPDDYPYKDQIGLIDVQLGFSTDGRNWQRAHDRAPVVPVGPAGARDAGLVFPQFNAPIVVDGDTYIYYSGWRFGHTAWAQKKVYQEEERDLRQSAYGMLAVMPEDHWVSFDAGAQEGILLAGPWRQLPHRLFINADAGDGSIEVEFVDGYERPLPGLGRADCIALGANGKNQEVKWRGDPRPSEVEGDYQGGVMVRIYMKNAKLYSCTFAMPDPDGSVRRYWTNLGWNKNIFHRSDQWSRDNNLPAGGLPPVTRGMPNY